MYELPAIFKLCLLLLLSITAVVACSTNQSNAQAQGVETFLRFQKTPCLGTCPFYEATIAQNGSMTFVGREHVAVKDSVVFQLSSEEMQALRAQVEQLNVQQLQDNYLTQWSDMPSTITTFYDKGKPLKHVKHEEGGPQSLQDFQKGLHRRIMELVDAEANRRLPVK